MVCHGQNTIWPLQALRSRKARLRRRDVDDLATRTVFGHNSNAVLLGEETRLMKDDGKRSVFPGEYPDRLPSDATACFPYFLPVIDEIGFLSLPFTS